MSTRQRIIAVFVLVIVLVYIYYTGNPRRINFVNISTPEGVPSTLTDGQSKISWSNLVPSLDFAPKLIIELTVILSVPLFSIVILVARHYL